MKIAVVGLGYVGLPLCLQFARACVSELGIDVDPTKVQLLNNRQSYIKHILPSAVAELVKSGKFSASTDFSRIKEVEARSTHRCQSMSYIASPTRLTLNKNPLMVQEFSCSAWLTSQMSMMNANRRVTC